MDIECDKTASVFLEQKGIVWIEKYYNGVIEQVAGGIGNVEHNSILVRYSNDFSIWDLESVNHLRTRQISFYLHEFSYNKIAEAYEPYLGLIRADVLNAH